MAANAYKTVDKAVADVNDIEIKLSKEQYKDLVQMIYLAAHFAEASESEKQMGGFGAVAQAVYSLAQKAGSTDWVGFDPIRKEYFYKPALEEALQPMVEGYDDQAFWSELADRMMLRDFEKSFGPEALEKMDPAEVYEKQEPFLAKYEEEFSRHGIDRLEIADQL